MVNDMRLCREDMVEKDNARALGWLKRNNCDTDGFSEMKCPCCGLKRMRKNEKENPTSVQNGMRICVGCGEIEKYKTKYGLQQIPVDKWSGISHSEKGEMAV